MSELAFGGMATATILSIVAWFDLVRQRSEWQYIASFFVGVFCAQTALRAVGL